MKINFTWLSFKNMSYRSWWFYFSFSRYVVRYTIGLFGFRVVIKEKHATEKLINMITRS